MKKILKNIMDRFIYHAENEDPKTIFERIMKIIVFIVMLVVCLGVLLFLFCYFFCFLFLLDGLYWIISGNTLVYKHLNF